MTGESAVAAGGSPTAALDHIVIAGPDLPELVVWFAERTGVTAQPGGRHPTGTQNALVALSVDGERGQQYIELIGPYDDATGLPLPTKFGIDRLEGPTVQTFAVRPDDIDAAVDRASGVGWETGPVGALSRLTPAGDLLEWRITWADQAAPDAPDAQRFDRPFFIDWGDTAHPGETIVPIVELIDFARIEPTSERADALRREFSAVDSNLIDVRVGSAAGFVLKLRTSAGDVVEFH